MIYRILVVTNGQAVKTQVKDCEDRDKAIAKAKRLAVAFPPSKGCFSPPGANPIEVHVRQVGQFNLPPTHWETIARFRRVAAYSKTGARLKTIEVTSVGLPVLKMKPLDERGKRILAIQGSPGHGMRNGKPCACAACADPDNITDAELLTLEKADAPAE